MGRALSSKSGSKIAAVSSASALRGGCSVNPTFLCVKTLPPMTSFSDRMRAR